MLSIPLLGEFTAIAKGIWHPYEEAESASVSFGAFSIQPTRLLGIGGLTMPKLTVPVLDFLKREALWITSYLDEDLRFGRGATGNSLCVPSRELTFFRSLHETVGLVTPGRSRGTGFERVASTNPGRVLPFGPGPQKPAATVATVAMVAMVAVVAMARLAAAQTVTVTGTSAALNLAGTDGS